jgi:hypothetical protein
MYDDDGRMYDLYDEMISERTESPPLQCYLTELIIGGEFYQKYSASNTNPLPYCETTMIPHNFLPVAFNEKKSDFLTPSPSVIPLFQASQLTSLHHNHHYYYSHTPSHKFLSY